MTKEFNVTVRPVSQSQLPRTPVKTICLSDRSIEIQISNQVSELRNFLLIAIEQMTNWLPFLEKVVVPPDMSNRVEKAAALAANIDWTKYNQRKLQLFVGQEFPSEQSLPEFGLRCKVIPHAQQRYNTVGDYEIVDGDVLEIRVSEEVGHFHQLLAVMLHEASEMLLCLQEGASSYPSSRTLVNS